MWAKLSFSSLLWKQRSVSLEGGSWSSFTLIRLLLEQIRASSHEVAFHADSPFLSFHSVFLSKTCFPGNKGAGFSSVENVICVGWGKTKRKKKKRKRNCWLSLVVCRAGQVLSSRLQRHEWIVKLKRLDGLRLTRSCTCSGVRSVLLRTSCIPSRARHQTWTHPEDEVEHEQKVFHAFHSSFHLPHVGWSALEYLSVFQPESCRKPRSGTITDY